MASILEKSSIRQAVLPITVEQYHHLCRAAIFSKRTELLGGVIIKQKIKSPLHTFIVRRVVDWLDGVVDPNGHVRKEEPLTFADSEPEPDIAVVRGYPEDYRARHPATAELVIEVAVATVHLDRDKADIYASANIPEYWVVAPAERSIDVYRTPTAQSYQTHFQITDAEAEVTTPVLPRFTRRLSEFFA